MRIRIPPKKMRETFLVVYELEGCQQALNFLAAFYGVRKMKIIFNGKKVSKECEAHYFENKAYFTKRGLKKRTVLHELYHHLIDAKGVEMSAREEEKKANMYARNLQNSVKTSRGH